MNHPTTTFAPRHPLADQFGARIAAQLDAAALQLPHDVSERLRAARTQALANRRVSEAVAAPAVLGHGGSAVLGGGFGFWGRAASWLPLVALTLGLLGIGTLQEEMRASEIAEVDAELLTGDLPPTAYTDPGFTQYLKLGGGD
jgi:hypothetical protein